MRYKITMVLVTIGLLTAPVTAVELNKLGSFSNSYNSQSDQVPGFITDIVGNERIEFNIDTENETKKLGIIMNGTRIEKTNSSGLSDPTLVVNTDKDTVDYVMSSSSPYQAVDSSLDTGNITYSAKTTGSKIKLGIFNFARSLIDLF